MHEVTAFWVERPGVGALRREALPPAREGEVLVRTLHTGISRGTESSVFLGRVPVSERERMRAPFQSGEFPGPVKYGYLNVGVVEAGPTHLAGRTVFTLFPHQSEFVVPVESVVPVPDGVPARRAVLAGAVETALNILWDAAPLIGDRVTVVGAGMIGCCVARLLRGIPEVDVVLVDVDETRHEVADLLDVGFSLPTDAPHERDLVVNTSGSGDGLQLALESVVTEGDVIEASWYGDRPVTLTLGADFHSRRLSIRSSQVGAVSPRRRGSRSTHDRLSLALRLLRDPAFDSLLTADSSWRELPAVMARLAGRTTIGIAATDTALADPPSSATPSTDICHTIDWKDAA